jgi:hypothetical protein
MTPHRPPRFALAAILCIASGTLALAQTPPPQDDETAPAAASSPHQREATKSNAQEAPANSATEPSSASSPHQREATRSKAEHDKMMKDCMKKEQQKNSSMSTQELKKTCAAQMKAHDSD